MKKWPRQARGPFAWFRREPQHSLSCEHASVRASRVRACGGTSSFGLDLYSISAHIQNTRISSLAVCLAGCLPGWLSLSVCHSVCLSLSVCLSGWLAGWLAGWLSVCLAADLNCFFNVVCVCHPCLHFYISACLHICMSAGLQVCMSACLHI